MYTVSNNVEHAQAVLNRAELECAKVGLRPDTKCNIVQNLHLWRYYAEVSQGLGLMGQLN